MGMYSYLEHSKQSILSLVSFVDTFTPIAVVLQNVFPITNQEHCLFLLSSLLHVLLFQSASSDNYKPPIQTF